MRVALLRREDLFAMLLELEGLIAFAAAKHEIGHALKASISCEPKRMDVNLTE